MHEGGYGCTLSRYLITGIVHEGTASLLPSQDQERTTYSEEYSHNETRGAWPCFAIVERHLIMKQARSALCVALCTRTKQPHLIDKVAAGASPRVSQATDDFSTVRLHSKL